MERRICRIVELLSNGYSSGDIVQFSAEKWNIGERMARNYLAKARQKIKQNLQIEVADEVELQRLRLESVYCDARKNGNLRVSLEALREISKFNGLEDASKTLRDKNQKSIWELAEIDPKDMRKVLRAMVADGSLDQDFKDAGITLIHDSE